MREFSVIIPTLLRDRFVLKKLLRNLSQQPAVREIILINNASTPFVFRSARLTILDAPQNIFVNPAWNWGARTARSEFLAILNDDIEIPRDTFARVAQFPVENWGVIGADKSCLYRKRFDFRPHLRAGKLRYAPAPERGYGFGIFMALHRNHYYEIPSDLKIWCGDDYLFERNRAAGKTNATLNLPIRTIMSRTSSAPEFKAIRREDYENFRRLQSVPHC